MRAVIVGLAFLLPLGAWAQLRVSIYPTEEHLVQQVLLGPGMKARNITYQGAFESIGQFDNVNSVLALADGLVMGTGDVRYAVGPNKGEGFSGMMETRGDRDLTNLASGNTYDAAVLAFDFVPKYDYIHFRYVFASDEYHEFVNSGFNDVFAFILINLETQEEVNLAVIPETNDPITINNINDERYSSFFRDNTLFKPSGSITHTIEYDGLTLPLLAYQRVTPGTPYRIKLAIADVSDQQYDSAVFLEAGSFQSQPEEEFVEENETYFSQFTQERLTLTPGERKTNPQDVVEPDTQISLDSANTDVAPTAVEESEAIRLNHIVYFDFDQSASTPEMIKSLQNFLHSLETLTLDSIRLDAHTDNRGSVSYNQSLSEKRGMWVRAFLMEKLDLEQKQVVVYAWNFSRPTTENTSEAKRARNRRVEITAFGK